MTPLHVEILGWAATVVFVGSYFCGGAERLVRVQILGALLWTAYGVLMKAPPVVAANLLVVAAATWKMRQPSRAAPSESHHGSLATHAGQLSRSRPRACRAPPAS